MTFFPLNAALLNDAARSLRAARDADFASRAEMASAWARLDDYAEGEAIVAAIDRARRVVATGDHVAEQYAAVARVLDITASLQRGLDEVLAFVVRAGSVMGEDSPTVASALGRIAALGHALDAACASQIEAICRATGGGLADRQGVTLAEYPDLPIDAVSELAYLTAPPEVRAFADAHPEVQLLESGDGLMVGVIGDLETAESTVTMVTGVGSSKPSSWDGYATRAQSIHQATGAATVMWMGYSAPANVATGTAHDPAIAGGAALRDFQTALAQRYPQQRRVVVGHSYGSVVAGRAAGPAGPGLRADDLIVMGSPGIGVDHARDLRLLDAQGHQVPAGHVHAVITGADPIDLTTTSLGGIHGPDPATPGFGTHVVHAASDGTHVTYWEDPVVLQLLRDTTAAPSATSGAGRY